MPCMPGYTECPLDPLKCSQSTEFQREHDVISVWELCTPKQ